MAEAATALNHDITSYPAELMAEHCCADNGIVVNDHLAGHLGGVAHYQAVAYDTVVGDVHVFHEQAA